MILTVSHRTTVFFVCCKTLLLYGQSKVVTVGCSEKSIRALQVLNKVFNRVIYGGRSCIERAVTQAFIFIFPPRCGISLGSHSMFQALNIRGLPSSLSDLAVVHSSPWREVWVNKFLNLHGHPDGSLSQVDRSYWKACDFWLKEETWLPKPLPLGFSTQVLHFGLMGARLPSRVHISRGPCSGWPERLQCHRQGLPDSALTCLPTRGARSSNSELPWAGSCVLTSWVWTYCGWDEMPRDAQSTLGIVTVFALQVMLFTGFKQPCLDFKTFTAIWEMDWEAVIISNFLVDEKLHRL